MTLTMLVGSFIGGVSSEGGGSVAFPVMTLIFSLSPLVARDFSLMIQSVGMTSGSLTILGMGVTLEYRSLLWATIGGVAGIAFGLEEVRAGFCVSARR